ncbi:tRNA (cytosine(72)-C(5))-methyltransferase NSUN6-like [Montipora capricornis]|uniref:tRNA (cytosine(72)-C(5))-methyltransferase NSUN6-like n=1 Tax=Montipora capricornis TaxID=246305 RepID=UPI0035F0FC58
MKFSWPTWDLAEFMWRYINKENDVFAVFLEYDKKALGLLKEGGVLVYSTCTLTPQENEHQVQWALKSFPCLSLERQTPHLGDPGLPNCGLLNDECRLVQLFDPAKSYKDKANENGNNLDTIGFFIAKFIKQRC